MRIIIAVVIFLISLQVQVVHGEEMNSYQQVISQRRLSEAKVLWSVMKADGFTETTVASLDFVFFSNSETEASGLIKALSESYTVEKTFSTDSDYVLIKGTTRPYGNDFTQEQWIGWVKYMVSIGFTHNAVFSTWTVYAPKLKTTWSSESIEAE